MASKAAELLPEHLLSTNEACQEINAYLKSKAKVPCAVALATVRECVVDKKLGSKAKHALKDLAMHSPGGAASGLLMHMVTILASAGKLDADERKIVRLAAYLLSRIAESTGVGVSAENHSTLEATAAGGKDIALRIACIRLLGSQCVQGEEGGRALASLCKQLQLLHKQYGADSEPAKGGKARKSILHAFGKRSKDEKEEQERMELARALHSATLAKMRQGTVSLDQYPLKAWRIPLDAATARHALAILLASLPVQPALVLEGLSGFLNNEAHRTTAEGDTIASVCLLRLCAKAAFSSAPESSSGAGSKGSRHQPKPLPASTELKAQCLKLVLDKLVSPSADTRVFLEAVTGICSPGGLASLGSAQQKTAVEAAATRLKGLMGDSCVLSRHAACRTAATLAACVCAQRLNGLTSVLLPLVDAAKKQVVAPCLSLQGHSLRVLAWLLDSPSLLVLLLQSLKGEEGQRQLTEPMLTQVARDLMYRARSDPVFAPLLLKFSVTWPREAPERCNPAMLGTIWCVCATLAVNDAVWKGAVLQALIEALDLPSDDRKLDGVVRSAIWAVAESAPYLMPDGSDILAGAWECVMFRLRHAGGYAKMETRHVAIHAIGRISLLLDDPVRIAGYEHLAALANEEGFGLMAEAVPYLSALDAWYGLVESGLADDKEGESWRKSAWKLVRDSSAQVGTS